ncbi:hypothetical protein BSY16_6175 (plasmid) [Sinorhizobium sp. RAC02]|nr:hypothetical protein BSY16_6175 [Sinorhizobium sp. RAC02]
MIDPPVCQLCNKDISLAHNPFRHLGKVANKDALRRFGFGHKCRPM